jgi:hypothetical protein
MTAGLPPAGAADEAAGTLSDRLRELEDAKDAGLVTEREFVAQRNRLLGVQ